MQLITLPSHILCDASRVINLILILGSLPICHIQLRFELVETLMYRVGLLFKVLDKVQLLTQIISVLSQRVLTAITLALQYTQLCDRFRPKPVSLSDAGLDSHILVALSIQI